VTDPDNEILAELLLRWEELHERGQDTPATELAKEHSHLIDELQRRINLIKQASWLDNPLDEDPPSEDGESPVRPKPPSRMLAGRYRLDELIAEGGFAQVYRAYDRDLQRTVAIKLPKPSRLESTEDFQAEARRVARLKHPGIVPVHDVGLDGDHCFIVSEYVEGGSLADRLVHTRPAKEQVVRWIADIADALEYAHLNGVVHRDIKPANILIDHHGRALLADFGIAQSASKTGKFAPSLGTLRYISPEQLEGRPSDHRSDIYSLAVVLHEALTGRPPYSSNEPNVLRKEIAGGVSPSSKEVPPGIFQVCRKALSKSLHQRHASAAQFGAELRRCIRSSQRPKWLALGIGILLVGLGVAFGLSFRTAPVPTPIERVGTSAVAAVPNADGPEIGSVESLPKLLYVANTNMQRERYAEAEGQYSEILQIKKDSAEVFAGRGFCRLNQRKFTEAIEDFTTALDLAPDDAMTRKYRTQALAEVGDFDRAIEDMSRVVQLMPNKPQATNTLADIYALRSHYRAENDMFPEAAQDMTEAIRLKPTAENYRRRSSCLYHSGKYEMAVDDLNVAISKEPTNPEFYDRRADCHEKMGHQDQAEQDRQKAESLGPAVPEPTVSPASEK
jgi:tetratricopeptide (TPR) repeat protein/tRNA A-37 threonylcarbamoyl transferase component Bud32